MTRSESILIPEQQLQQIYLKVLALLTSALYFEV